MGAQAVRLSNVDIDNALKNKDFEVLFQPIFDLGNGALARMEAFIRWRHPTLGVLPPGAFISFFESQGRMSELTRYVLAQALDAYIEWRGPYPPGLSINLALSDLSDEAFASHFIKLLRDRDFPADLVTLECPMPPVDIDIDAASAQFARLSGTGARLAIEVRGRANDLLRNIDPFPFDEIKTGGSSILRFARTVRGPGLSAISDLLDIATKANAVITAVGVEDQASLSALRGLGFTAAQGNHLAKVGELSDFLPSRVNEVRALLGLETLSSESLSALFRTEAPAPKAADPELLKAVDDGKPDALIKRLNKRVARQTVQKEKQESRSDAPSAEDAARKAKAREKAKALALAKRAKAREERKAAAIARAKAKAAQSHQGETETEAEDNSAFPPVTAPRALQDRLNKEFAGQIETAQQEKAKKAPTDADVDLPLFEEPAIASSEDSAEPKQEETPAKEKEEKLSVPERLVAAMEQKQMEKEKARGETAEQKQQKTEAPPAEEEKEEEVIESVALAVGGAGAYFQPGIKVGGPPHASRLERPSLAAADQFGDLATPQTPMEEAPARPVTEAPLNQPEDAPVQEPLTASRDLKEDAESSVDHLMDQGHLHEEYGYQPPGPEKPKRKNFLTRTVLPYPTHFWPKSWKRRYRRWTKKQPANKADATAQAAE